LRHPEASCVSIAVWSESSGARIVRMGKFVQSVPHTKALDTLSVTRQIKSYGAGERISYHALPVEWVIQVTGYPTERSRPSAQPTLNQFVRHHSVQYRHLAYKECLHWINWNATGG
jgi:hypothetical protein